MDMTHFQLDENKCTGCGTCTKVCCGELLSVDERGKARIAPVTEFGWPGVCWMKIPEYRPQAARFPEDESGQRRRLRSQMNIRPPMPLRQDFLAVQNGLSATDAAEKDTLNSPIPFPERVNHVPHAI